MTTPDPAFFHMFLPVHKVEVVHMRIYDVVIITLAVKPGFPASTEPPSADIRVAKGTGMEWCKANLGITPEEINPVAVPTAEVG